MDLARRGYAVIDPSRLISSIRHDKSIDLQHEADLIKEIWVKATIVQKCLELGYNTWLIDGNMIPCNGSLPELPHSPYEFAAAKDVELLFVKSSPSSLQIWNDDYIHKVATKGKSLLESNSPLTRDKNFVYLAATALAEEGNIPLWRFDDSTYGLKLGHATRKSDSLTKMNIIFWDQSMTFASVLGELERMGMWLIDAESSCTSVVCHRR